MPLFPTTPQYTPVLDKDVKLAYDTRNQRASGEITNQYSQPTTPSTPTTSVPSIPTQTASTYYFGRSGGGGSRNVTPTPIQNISSTVTESRSGVEIAREKFAAEAQSKGYDIKPSDIAIINSRATLSPKYYNQDTGMYQIPYTQEKKDLMTGFSQRYPQQQPANLRETFGIPQNVSSQSSSGNYKINQSSFGSTIDFKRQINPSETINPYNYPSQLFQFGEYKGEIKGIRQNLVNVGNTAKIALGNYFKYGGKFDKFIGGSPVDSGRTLASYSPKLYDVGSEIYYSAKDTVQNLMLDISPIKADLKFAENSDKLGKFGQLSIVGGKIEPKFPLAATGAATAYFGYSLATKPVQTTKETISYSITPKGIGENLASFYFLKGISEGASIKLIETSKPFTKPITVPISDNLIKLYGGTKSKIQTGINLEIGGYRILKKSYSQSGQSYLPNFYRRFLYKEEVALGQYRGIKEFDAYSDFSSGNRVNKEILDIAKKDQTIVGVQATNAPIEKAIRKGKFVTKSPDTSQVGARGKYDLTGYYKSVPRTSQINKATSLINKEYGQFSVYKSYIFSDDYSAGLLDKSGSPTLDISIGKIQDPATIPKLTNKQIKNILKDDPELAKSIIDSPLKKQSFETFVFGEGSKFQISPENIGFKEFTSSERQTIVLREVKLQSLRKEKYQTYISKDLTNLYSSKTRQFFDKIGLPDLLPKSELRLTKLTFTKPLPFAKEVQDRNKELLKDIKTGDFKIINTQEFKSDFENYLSSSSKPTIYSNTQAKYPALLQKISPPKIKENENISQNYSANNYKNYNNLKSKANESYVSKNSSSYAIIPSSYKSNVSNDSKISNTYDSYSGSSISSSSYKPYSESKISKSSSSISSSKSSSLSKSSYSRNYYGSSLKKISSSSKSYNYKSNKEYKPVQTFKYEKPKYKFKEYKYARLVIPDLYSVNITEAKTGKEATAPVLNKLSRSQAYSQFRGYGVGIVYTEEIKKGEVRI